MASKATLKQVAVRAGVSYQTVSKVLNKQAQVSRETEKRIHEAVHELGYRPNQIARNMRA
jgi:LacI family transcriptional regulator